MLKVTLRRQSANLRPASPCYLNENPAWQYVHVGYAKPKPLLLPPLALSPIDVRSPARVCNESMDLVGLDASTMESRQAKLDSKVRNVGVSLKKIARDMNAVIANEQANNASSTIPRAKRNLVSSLNVEVFEKMEQFENCINFAKEDAAVSGLLYIRHFDFC